MGKCKVEVYSRVTGFFRPVQDWNKGKKEEFKDRVTFKENNAVNQDESQVSDKHEKVGRVVFEAYI